MKNSYVGRGAHWIVLSLFFAVAGCGGDSGIRNDGDNGDGGSDPTAVTVSNNFFSPEVPSSGPDEGTVVGPQRATLRVFSDALTVPNREISPTSQFLAPLYRVPTRNCIAHSFGLYSVLSLS